MLQRSKFLESTVTAVIADPTIDPGQELLTNSTFAPSHIVPTISDPGTASTASPVDISAPPQQFYLPSVPDFSQDSSLSYSTAVSAVSGITQCCLLR